MIHYFDLHISFVYFSELTDTWTPASYVCERVPWPENKQLMELSQEYIANAKGVSIDHVVIFNVMKMREVE